MKRALMLSCFLLITSLLGLLSADRGVRAQPETIIEVNRFNDLTDNNLSDGICNVALSGCTLRAAVQQANVDKGADTIMLPAGQYFLEINGANENQAERGDLDIADDVTIVGVSGTNGERVVINGGMLNDRVFHVLTGTVILQNLTIESGSTNSGGGGIFNSAIAIVDRCIVQNNETVRDGFDLLAGGGGIYNSGEMMIMESIIRQNNSTTSLGGATITEAGGIYNSGSIEIYSSTIQNNLTSGSVIINRGGGLSNANTGVVAMYTSTIALNSATAQSGFGGGVANNGKFKLSGSLIISNSAASGGGLLNNGNLTLERSAVAGNLANGVTQEGDSIGSGGGINNSGNATIINSTVSNNRGRGNGGGIATYGALLLDSATVANNLIAVDSKRNVNGGGVWASDPNAIRMHNSIVSGNHDEDLDDSAPDCSGVVESQGHNLIGMSIGCTITTTVSDLIGMEDAAIDAKLALLSDNGGDTWTHALLEDSPAIDAGECSTVTIDQRDVRRPQGAACDIGAFELVFSAIPAPEIFLPLVTH